MPKWVKIDENGTILAAYTVDAPQEIDKPINTDIPLQELIGMKWIDENTVVQIEIPVEPEPPALPRTRLTRLEFRNQFTMAEKQALYTAAQSNIDIQIFLDDVNAAEYVETTDQVTIDGLSALVSAGLLTQARADEILVGLLEVVS